MKKWIVRAILVIAIAIGLNFIWQYFSLLKIAKRLIADLDQAQLTVSKLDGHLRTQVALNKRLEEERVILERELVSTREEIKRSQMAIDRLEQDLDGLKIHVSALAKNNKLLRSRINNLAVAKSKLETEIEMLVQEKENLEARFYSLSELRKAIKDLKKNHSKKRDIPSESLDQASSGNKGYLFRRGESTYRPKVEIKVLPAP